MALLHLLVLRLFRLRVVGREHLPRPPFIIASNHQSWFDTAFIVAAFPSRPMVYTMARRDTVFDRGWKRWLVPKFGVFPIAPRRGELDQQGLATVYQVLSRGGAVLVFPEGRYSRGRALWPLKKGVAHFALQAGVPICPVALSGLDRLRPWRLVEVSIGPPVRPDPPAWWTLQRRVERVLDGVRRSILLAFEQRSDGQRPWRSRLARARSRVGDGVRRAGGLPRRLRGDLDRGRKAPPGGRPDVHP